GPAQRQSCVIMPPDFHPSVFRFRSEIPVSAGHSIARGQTFMSKTSLDKSKIKFLLLEGVHQSAVNRLSAAGYTNVEYLKTVLGADDLIDEIPDAHCVGLRSRTQLTRRVIENAPERIAAGCFCSGTNQVDLNAAQEHGVAA